MDLLIPVGVLLLVVAVAALLLARQGKARQAERTAQQYGSRHGRKSTYQPTFEDPGARPGPASGPAFPSTTAAPGTVPSPADAQIQEAMEQMAGNLAALLKKKGAGNATLEATVTTASTSSSFSLTGQTADRIRALALAGRREEAIALLSSETGMDGQGAGMMVDMMLAQF